MEIEVVRLSPRRARWTVGGQTTQGNIAASNKLTLFAARVGVSVDDLIARAQAAPVPVAAPRAPVGPPPPDARARQDDGDSTVKLRVRPLLGRSCDAKVVEASTVGDAFREALEHHTDGPSVIYWRGVRRLACLDVDFHRAAPPSRVTLRAALTKLSPRPFAIWISHGEGIHALYHEQGGLDADEVAATAALSVRDLLPTATVEILDATNHPVPTRVKEGKRQRCSRVEWQEQSLDGALRQWVGSEEEEVTEEDIAEWLDQRGMELDTRHAHTQCPFDPSDAGGNPPVIPSEQGVVCFKCRNQGHISGGYAPWRKLVYGRKLSRILGCARSWVPWEHAQYVVLEDYGGRFPVSLLKRAYFALAKLEHGVDDPRLHRLRRDYGCVRGSGGLWLSATSLEPITPRVSEHRLREMPSSRDAWTDDNGDWNERVSGVKLDHHLTNEKIPGWPEIVAIRGAPVWGQWLPYDDGRVRAQLHCGKNPSRYLSPSKRTGLKECEEHLQEKFPGLNLDYLRLLIVARGYAESGKGMVPMIMSLGPSGSGKTLTTYLAASILGDVAARVPAGNWQESFGYQSKRAGLVILDEFAKGLRGNKLRRAFDFLLEIDRTYVYRRLYTGPTNDPILSPVVITNNDYGPEVLEHAQVGRRVVVVRLPTQPRVDWQTSCGTGDIRYWRDDPDNAIICDSFMSHMIDEWFSDAEGAREGQLNWFDAAEAIGFPRLRDSRNSAVFAGLRVEDMIRTLYLELQRLPDPGKEYAQFRGRGWRVVPLDDHEHPATRVWQELCDDWRDPDGRGSSIKINERDLSRVLGVELEPAQSVKFFAIRRGSKLFAKFAHQTSRKKYLVGADIKVDLERAASE